MQSRQVRIGIIGAVHDHFWPVWGRGLLQEFRDQTGVLLVAATEQNPQVRSKLRAEAGIEQLYTDYNEMLENETLDAVLIGLPNNSKVAPIQAAARKGLHVLLDKPLCTRLEDAMTIHEAVSRANIKLIVNSQLIWKAPLRKSIELIRDGAIGRPFWTKWRTANPGSENYGPGANSFFTDWLWNVEKNGGGILINYCYYGISYICHLFGRPESVSAMSGHFVKQNIPDAMEDNAVVTMRWPHALGQAEGSWTQFDEGTEEDVDPTNKGGIVYGTEGVLRSSDKGYVVLTNRVAPKGRRIESTTTNLPWKNGAEHFVSVVRGECEVDALCSLEHNIQVQQVISAAYQSIREKREIFLT